MQYQDMHISKMNAQTLFQIDEITTAARAHNDNILHLQDSYPSRAPVVFRYQRWLISCLFTAKKDDEFIDLLSKKRVILAVSAARASSIIYCIQRILYFHQVAGGRLTSFMKCDGVSHVDNFRLYRAIKRNTSS